MDTGGTREILAHGQGGIVAADVAGLAEAVRRLVDDAALRQQLKESARRRARAFSPETLIPRYEAVYRGLE
jgi:glycosyltransferase involved in cell wall biosynthesis